MKLEALCDVVPDGTGRVYRQGRLMGAISTFVLGGILTGAPLLWYFVGAPWPVWALCAALAVFIVPMLVGDLRAKLRDTNWVLWVRHDGVWINFRSYQETSTDDEACVVKLDYAEIAEARKHVEKFTTPSKKTGSTYYSVHCLDLELTHAETAALAQALADNRRRPAPQRFYCGIGVTSRASHFPVSLPAPDCIRVAWRGGVGNWVAPSLGHVLRELAAYVRTGEAVVHRRPDWKRLSDEELDRQILELVEAGNRIDAMKLLVVRRGYDTTEAKQFVDGLTAAV